MKKTKLLFIVMLLTASGIKAQCDLYESAWVDKAKEFTHFEIIKEGDSFYLQHWVKEKLKIQGQGPFFVSLNGKQIDLFIAADSGELRFGNTAFIPEFKSKKRRFAGRWVNEQLGVSHEIRINNGGVNWKMIKQGEKPIPFWPKLTENGYTFSFGEEQLYFTIEEGKLCDAQGNKFTQIGSF